MARHHKKKKHQPAANSSSSHVANGVSKPPNPTERIPKSMVIRMGASDIGTSISQLVLDMRNVMEPHTASRLKERRSNRLRDYTTMAGPLGVTQFMLFYRSKTSGNPNLKIAIAPRGPTLSFHVERYSVAKDVAKSQRRPKMGNKSADHLTPPLLVMNNFVTPEGGENGKVPSTNGGDERPPIPRRLENLVTSTFQSLFPPISPQRTPLSTIRRVLLINREVSSNDPSSYVLTLRHYAISSRPLTNASRAVKRMQAAERHLKRKGKKTGVPNISHLQDIGDFMDEQGGFTSASETKLDTDAEVEVTETRARKVLGKKEFLKLRQQQKEEREAATEAGAEDHEDQAGDEAEREKRNETPLATKPLPSVTQKKAIKLTEIGPRMTLRLYKVEEGLASGKVMWHQSIEKSEEEAKKLDEVWEKRKAEREERKRVQRENVERKKAAKKKDPKKKQDGAEDDEEGDEDENEELWSDDDLLDEDGGVDIAEDEQRLELETADEDEVDAMSDT
ncbi:MAG: hypothetical protein M1828_001811 [Chrysothrix sp. TS-e1954]|nr:MAG: hypothetical protein M1828_001811 [Chrysothrix sp. TS-e1954]